MPSILHNVFVDACEAHAEQWKENNWEYYTTVMCCSAVGRKNSKTVEKGYNALVSAMEVEDSLEAVLEGQHAKLCVLPKNHPGKCTSNAHASIINNKTVACKLEWIYCTPGNNDFVFKNRSDRLFPIRLSDSMEKVVRNKEVKLKCAIPLKDASTPEFLASAYLDYLTVIMNVRGIEQYLNEKSAYYKLMLPVVIAHKEVMASYYRSNKKMIFDEEGFSVCPVTGNRFDIEHFLLDRDHPDGVQLGHVEPRSCYEYTIRGGNVLLMSRDGNRIIGDYSFLENEWIEKLKSILSFHES
jgi:hypothetical protein